jgi:hypothetical protein
MKIMKSCIVEFQRALNTAYLDVSTSRTCSLRTVSIQLVSELRSRYVGSAARSYVHPAPFRTCDIDVVVAVASCLIMKLLSQIRKTNNKKSVRGGKEQQSTKFM